MMKHLMKMTLVIIALSIIHSVIVSHADNDIKDTILSSFQDKPRKELFKVYHFLFQKKYDLNSEEGLNKYRTFKANMKMIEAENAKNLGYTLGITDFTDLTKDEFRKNVLTDLSQIEAGMQRFLSSEFNHNKFEIHNQDEDDLLISMSKSDLYVNQNTTRINWTAKMNPVTNQGGCGSCWAFCTIHALEGNYNIQYRNSPAFSPQQLVDCDRNNLGCNGGWPDSALNYLVKNGMANSTSYPYTSGKTGKAGTCLEKNVKLNKIVTGFESCPWGKCTRSQQRALLTKGPLIVVVDADGDTKSSSVFQHYKSGIIVTSCDKPNHGVVLTGIDIDNKGEILLGMNSWGAGWGEKGHFRIRVNDKDKTCFIESYASLPKVQKIINSVPS